MSGLAAAQAFAVHAEEAGVFLDRREQAAPLALELDAQHVDHVAARQNVVEAVGDLRRPVRSMSRGHQRRRAADDHVGTELRQAVNVAAGHPAMSDVADQADGQPFESALDLPNGEDVEQALRRMFVGAVAGVDDAALQMLGQAEWCPGDGMADDHDVDAHRLDVLGGVDEGLALAEAGAGGVKSSVSAESRRAARLKLVRVRVEGSKKRLTTTLPLSSRALASPGKSSHQRNPPPESRIVSISWRLRTSLEAQEMTTGPRHGRGAMGGCKLHAHGNASGDASTDPYPASRDKSPLACPSQDKPRAWVPTRGMLRGVLRAWPGSVHLKVRAEPAPEVESWQLAGERPRRSISSSRSAREPFPPR